MWSCEQPWIGIVSAVTFFFFLSVYPIRGRHRRSPPTAPCILLLPLLLLFLPYLGDSSFLHSTFFSPVAPYFLQFCFLSYFFFFSFLLWMEGCCRYSQALRKQTKKRRFMDAVLCIETVWSLIPKICFRTVLQIKPENFKPLNTSYSGYLFS